MHAQSAQKQSADHGVHARDLSVHNAGHFEIQASLCFCGGYVHPFPAQLQKLLIWENPFKKAAPHTFVIRSC